MYSLSELGFERQKQIERQQTDNQRNLTCILKKKGKNFRHKKLKKIVLKTLKELALSHNITSNWFPFVCTSCLFLNSTYRVILRHLPEKEKLFFSYAPCRNYQTCNKVIKFFNFIDLIDRTCLQNYNLNSKIRAMDFI